MSVVTVSSIRKCNSMNKKTNAKSQWQQRGDVEELAGALTIIGIAGIIIINVSECRTFPI